jgi:hypothetical protein
VKNSDVKAAREQPAYDPFFKIQPIIDALITQFQGVCTPDELLTTEEAVCPFQGHIFHVCIKRKPYKCGIKVLKLYEAKCIYVCNVEIYTRAHPTSSEHNTVFTIGDWLYDEMK